MKFQKKLQNEAPSVLICDEYRTALIKYKIFKKHIASMSTESIRERNSQRVDSECCICLEQFRVASDMISTSCDHQFHPYCLIKSLGTGACNSCPLCRRSAAGLVPSGYDGDCLRFLAMIQVNVNAVQRCHENMLRLLDTELNSYQQHFVSLRHRAVNERQQLNSEILKSLERLDATMQYDALNYEGFRKILKKFDKRTGCCVSSSMLTDLQRHGFFLDSSVFGNGRCAALRIALQSLLRALRVPR
jgi:SPX domain protein involved in polyphosphate accumulation